jgi:spoIIIJ-associated protein
MSNYQEFTGKTVEEALRDAREAFGVASFDELDFEILTPGSRGVLGMGAEPARIVAAPRSALGGAAPRREAAAATPLPPPPAREGRDRDDRGDRRDRFDRGDRGDRGRGDRGRGDRPDRGDRDRRPPRAEGPADERPEAAAPGGQDDVAETRAERPDRAEGSERPERAERPDRAAPRADRGDRPERSDRPERAERGERRDRGDRGGRDRGPRSERPLDEGEVTRASRAAQAVDREEIQAAEASPEALAAARDILEQMLRHMGYQASVTISAGDTSKLDVTGEEDEKEALGALIGRKGERLSALQHLVNLMVSRKMGAWTRVLVDVEDYRGRRERQLRDIANRAAERVIETGKMLQLEPMTPLERRWIHLSLRDHPEVTTQSIGDEPQRRVVVLRRPA